MSPCPKTPPLRDKPWLLAQRDMPCILTGLRAHDGESVVAMHIGTGGKGVKTGDDETLPVMSNLHTGGHHSGEISMLRRAAPNWLLRLAFKAYAREMYRQWKEGR